MNEMKTEKTEPRMSVLDLLLRPELPNVQKTLPTAKYRVKRLSELAGEDVVFTLRGLPYGKVQELKESTGEFNVLVTLAGVADPDFKAPRLAEKYGGVTPAETVKAMLLPGEIEDISRAVEKLCGYRSATIEEVKNA